jgi:hypothetical protein
MDRLIMAGLHLIQNKTTASFIWTKSANDILEKVKRGRQTLNMLQSV